jgi:triosephosphate isomerase
MNKTPEESISFIDAFLGKLGALHDEEVLLIPPYTSLESTGRRLAGSAVGLGAQDLHHERSGAFTGAVSVSMLAACGCRYVLVGHSERRHVFGDDDSMVRRKLGAALDGGLLPILCVGETIEQRRGGETEAVLGRQLDGGLDEVPANVVERIVVAYEPVWAIGTGETATPEQAQDAIGWIRARLSDAYGAPVAERLRILYGGSVKPGNAADLLARPDIDGALVGGASLDPDAFAEIVRAGAAER